MKVFAREIKGAIWGKLGVCAKGAGLVWLAFALMLVGCKNNAGGGAPSAPVRNPAPPTPVAEDPADDTSNSKITYTFEDDGYYFTSKLKVSGTFGEIKDKASGCSDYVVGDNYFLGWTISGEDEIVADEASFENDTTFTAKYENVQLSKYVFVADGYEVAFKRLPSGSSFGDIKTQLDSKLNSYVVGENNFLGWTVEGDKELVEDDVTFSGDTTFVAKYNHFRKVSASEITRDVWMSASDNGVYLLFPRVSEEEYGGEFFLIKASSSNDAYDKKLDYDILLKEKKNAEDEYAKRHGGGRGGQDKDPAVMSVQNKINEFRAENFIDEGQWFIVDEYGFYLWGSVVNASVHLDLSGQNIIDDDENIVYKK